MDGRNVIPTTDATPSTSLAAGGSESMRAPSTARSVTGRLVPAGHWRALSLAIAEISANPIATIETWRRNLPEVRTMDDVTRDYLELYTR